MFSTERRTSWTVNGTNCSKKQTQFQNWPHCEVKCLFKSLGLIATDQTASNLWQTILHCSKHASKSTKETSMQVCLFTTSCKGFRHSHISLLLQSNGMLASVFSWKAHIMNSQWHQLFQETDSKQFQNWPHCEVKRLLVSLGLHHSGLAKYFLVRWALGIGPVWRTSLAFWILGTLEEHLQDLASFERPEANRTSC